MISPTTLAAATRVAERAALVAGQSVAAALSAMQPRDAHASAPAGAAAADDAADACSTPDTDESPSGGAGAWAASRDAGPQGKARPFTSTSAGSSKNA